MERTVSATEARIHFGELIQGVVEKQEAVIVEKSGKPQVVVVSVEEYERLKNRQTEDNWQSALERLTRLRERIAARRQGQPIPSSVDIIREMREERDEQLFNNLR